MKKEYIGDSVHVEMNRFNNLELTTKKDRIVLVPHVLKELLAYIEKWQKEPVT